MFGELARESRSGTKGEGVGRVVKNDLLVQSGVYPIFVLAVSVRFAFAFQLQ